MTTIEALEKTRNYFARINGGNNPSVYAINVAIKALEDQPKYEAAMGKMSTYFRCDKLKDLYVSEEECHKYKSCEECMVKYFKNKVGLDGDVNVQLNTTHSSDCGQFAGWRVYWINSDRIMCGGERG